MIKWEKLKNSEVSFADDKYIPIFGGLRTILLFRCEVVQTESGILGEHCCKESLNLVTEEVEQFSLLVDKLVVESTLEGLQTVAGKKNHSFPFFIF